ncbi:unnamed protein product [Moneuplotes crassus]|uniref:C3H1-type domain-containing protein n=1 Tax=Euplotes crassus TaxID=5936 RepID=A0AAD2CVS8_EUPCR|nr:unnamed protein product [Moneuplotes crassus]
MLANFKNTWSAPESLEGPADSKDTTPTSKKSKLSKQSKEFKMPKVALSQEKVGEGEIYAKETPSSSSTRTGTSDSDFSTEGSDSENEAKSMKLSSAAFYLKSNSLPLEKVTSPTSEFSNEASLLDRMDVKQECDDRKIKACFETHTQLDNQVNESDTVTSTHGSLPSKPKNKLSQRKGPKKFVESFRAKKKTEICKNWETTGKCKFGKSCAFAHGFDELLVKNNLPQKYKTKICKQFHEEGYCRYATRCQFIHCIVQKDLNSYSYSDILKETVFQYETRSKLKNFPELEDQMINPIKTKRLNVFSEIAPNTERISDREIPRVWDVSANLNSDSQA